MSALISNPLKIVVVLNSTRPRAGLPIPPFLQITEVEKALKQDGTPSHPTLDSRMDRLIRSLTGLLERCGTNEKNAGTLE
ncbi:hypothetical protein [Pajaroellobacter abortibovis]|nr:hypothetical protein [Pajaroellobacter abortibovis]